MTSGIEKEDPFSYYIDSYFNLMKYMIFLEEYLERDRIKNPQMFRQGEILNMLRATYWSRLRKGFSQYMS